MVIPANGNGKMQLPPGPTAPVTIYRQPEPPRRSRSRLALSILGWALTVIVVCVAGVAGGAYLYLHETVAAVAPHSIDVKVTAKRARPPDRGRAGDGARDRLRPPGRRGEGRAFALGHADVDPGRIRKNETISLLSFPRDLRAEIVCPGKATYVDQDQRRLCELRLARDARHGAQAHRRPGQLPDHRQLPRLHPGRRQARRHVDGRRPPLLQQPQRPHRLRDDQPAAGLPEAQRLPGARLRALPAHRQRPLPQRAPAELRPRAQGSDPHRASRSSSCRR